MEKECNCCKLIKPLSEFYFKKRKGKEYYENSCKRCFKIQVTKRTIDRKNGIECEFVLKDETNLKYKICNKCNVNQEIFNFRINRVGESRIIYETECKQCESIRSKLYREKPEVKARRKEYENRPENKLKASLRKKLESTEKSLYFNAKKRANKKNLEFNIILEDIIIPEFCPIFGIKLNTELERGHSTKNNSPSIDRIDNSKGYTKDNIWVISYKANKAKNDLNLNELKLLYDKTEKKINSV